jgi:hypothetical protein
LNDKAAGCRIAFATDDVPAACKKAIAEGASDYKEPIKKPWRQTVAYVRDNNGFLVELCSPAAAQERNGHASKHC